MTSEFLVYLRLGFEHILDLRGMDHILFVVALTVVYAPREWRAVVVQVTAFTVGHSVTLVLATLDVVRVSTAWVEFLIPVTILATSLVQMGRVGSAAPSRPSSPTPTPGWRVAPVIWVLALGFGLVHGLGFSNFLRALLGREASLTLPLFSFNVGLELGQLVIVAATLLAGAVATRLVNASRVLRVRVIGGAIAAVAVYLSVDRLPF